TQRAAGGALGAPGHAGGLLSGGRQGGEGRRVCPLRPALAANRRGPPPAPAGCHLPTPSRAGKNLEQGRPSERGSGKRAAVGGAAQTGASAGAWSGGLEAGFRPAPQGRGSESSRR